MKAAPSYRRFGSASMMLPILAAACVQSEPASPPPVASLSPETPVAVSGGKIQGAVSNLDPEVMSFMGLPFAAPPVGNLRWRPPEPVVAWDGVRDTTAPGPICQQGEELEQVRLVMERAHPDCSTCAVCARLDLPLYAGAADPDGCEARLAPCG